MGTYAFPPPMGISSFGYSDIVASSCGIQPFYSNLSPQQYGAIYFEKKWEPEPETFTPEVKPDTPKRNPNGYRQRKLKARLNQV